MGNKNIFIIILLFCVNILFAQTGKELEFNVVKPKVDISITPAYNFLYQHLSHPVKIVVDDSLHQYVYKLAGGTINETDTGTFITPEAKNEAILNVYEIKKGKEILVGSKKYLVLPEPKPYLRNKPTDNVLLDILLVSGTLKGVSEFERKKLTLPVTSFTIEYQGEGSLFKSVDVIGNEIPLPTRKDIMKLQNGAMIYFENIMIELMPGYETEIHSYRVSMEVKENSEVKSFGIGK